MARVFASLQTCRRIETATARDLARAAEQAGGFSLSVGLGTAIFAGPDSPLTKVVGVDLDLDALAEAQHRFARAGAAVPVELPTLAEPALAQALSARSYAVVGFEDVLARPLGTNTPADPSFDVRPSDSGDLEAWLDVLVEGFAHPDGSGPEAATSFPRDVVRKAVRAMATTSQRFTVFVDGVAAAAGSMTTIDGIAFLSGTATLPAFRRRGLQTALLHHRLRTAATQGAELACITTSPGSKSKQNAMRRGFAGIYTRVLMRRELD